MFERKGKLPPSDRRTVPDDGGPGDAELLAEFRRGDERSFELLYHRYRRLLYGYLNNLCGGNAAEADEVFEETWLRVIDKASGYRDDGKFSAWLFRIARNIFIDRIRRDRPELRAEVEVESVLDESAAELSPERELGAADARELVARALAELPPEQREVFLLREEELSFREIAEVMDRTEEWARVTYYRGKLSLRKELEK